MSELAPRSGSTGSKQQQRSSLAARRRSTIVEVAEQHFDKNTIILCVNLVILCVLVGILYVIATSAMNVSGASSKYSQHHKGEH